MIEEARRNIRRKGPEALRDLEWILKTIRTETSRPPGSVIPVDVSWLPEKDRPVLQSAMRLACDVLLTGDRTHFGAAYGKVFGGCTVFSPQALAERLLKK